VLSDKTGLTPAPGQVTQLEPRRSWLTFLIGSPLATAEAQGEAIGKVIGLAVFASDALSSTAYATQEMLVVLVAAGVAAFGYALPLSLAIIALLAILTLSYEQTIHAYPNGGGAYIVSRDNLSELAAGTAGAALLTDYVLTVAVSVSAGVAQITSAFPALLPIRVPFAVALVLVLMIINLRGVREAGNFFAIPTYFFLIVMFATVGVGLAKYLTGSLGTVVHPPPAEAVQAVETISLFLILRAFSSGTTALTGVEAISNGVPVFKEPRARNAGSTLVWMSVILAFLLVSITFLSVHIGAVPSEAETVISQLARTVWGGRGPLYLAVIAGTTVILIMAANTSYAGFPRLSALLATDGFLPEQLALRGTRLVYSRGIMTLALIASVLIVIFRASVTALIPLYAIGVFLSFTLSQAGMALRWKKSGQLQPGQEIQGQYSPLRHDPAWRTKMAINGAGAVCTAVVTVVFAVTKFSAGAWIIIILVPALVAVFFRIHRYYQAEKREMSLERLQPAPPIRHNRVILTIGRLHPAALAALRYAQALSDDVVAVHVATDPEEPERLRSQWRTWADGVPLQIIDSPYRLVLEPLVAHIKGLAVQQRPDEAITVVVPQLVTGDLFDNMLQSHAADFLRLALFFTPGVVVTDVPCQFDPSDESSTSKAEDGK
jgi:amino acid transporter